MPRDLHPRQSSDAEIAGLRSIAEGMVDDLSRRVLARQRLAIIEDLDHAADRLRHLGMVREAGLVDHVSRSVREDLR